MSWFNKTFRFVHRTERVLDIPKEIIMENILDFEHVNYVHKRCFAYNRVVAKHGNTTLLEYGVRHIPGIPIVTDYIMFHEYHPPNKVVHYAKPVKSRRWTRNRMELKDVETETGTRTYYESVHEGDLPVFLYPFRKLLLKLADWWGGIVWSEDEAILQRRMQVLDRGFKDGQFCGYWKFEDGTSRFQFRD